MSTGVSIFFKYPHQRIRMSVSADVFKVPHQSWMDGCWCQDYGCNYPRQLLSVSLTLCFVFQSITLFQKATSHLSMHTRSVASRPTLKSAVTICYMSASHPGLTKSHRIWKFWSKTMVTIITLKDLFIMLKIAYLC